MSASKKSNRNALTHGLYARDVLLPWDSKDHFEKLLEDLKAEFDPHGRAEEETVLDLALTFWKKRNLWRMHQTAVFKDPFTSEIVETNARSWSKIRRELRAAAMAEGRVQAEADGMLSVMLHHVRRLHRKLAKCSGPEEATALEKEIAEGLRLVNERALPLVQKLRQGPNAEKAFDRAYAPESVEQNFRLDAMLDARIGKLLARLVGLKEYKRTPAARSYTLEQSHSGSV
jgi:hypothetical protein